MDPTDPNTLVPDSSTTTPPPVTAVAAGLLAEPTFEECIEEWNRYHDDATAGRLRRANVPAGHHVAYFAGRIHDHDHDPCALRARVATALRVHPARIVVNYPWAW